MSEMPPLHYEPLHINTRTERDERLKKPFLGCVWRAMRWVNVRIPLRIYYELPLGRKSVTRQLSARTDFPTAEWQATGCSLDSAVRLLKILADKMEWPNPNFIPDDPLGLLFVHGYNEDAALHALWQVEKSFGNRYSATDVSKMILERWTVGDFVRDALARSQKTI